MVKEVIEENGFFSIWYYPQHKMIHHQIHTPISGQKLRELMLLGIEYIVKHSCYKWLSDDRGNAILTPEDIEWGERLWRPKAIAAGWQYWGIVLKDEEIIKLPIESVIKQYRELGLTAKIFNNVDSALQWLIEN